jgi:hypothetical protein
MRRHFLSLQCTAESRLDEGPVAPDACRYLFVIFVGDRVYVKKRMM